MFPLLGTKQQHHNYYGVLTTSAKGQQLEMGKKHCTDDGEEYETVTDENIVVRVCVKNPLSFS